ncbi:hypothetical protein NM688_g74 [Phlebia brevispora]|uniref:Uncharacterized protein n=1 Tax=Phlebia brevispora TaxID=194682 RepID=A0ACC1TF52_9APHY|nr:hypothetical protein NM688_g74 [Phlebia brevispora]
MLSRILLLDTLAVHNVIVFNFAFVVFLRLQPIWLGRSLSQYVCFAHAHATLHIRQRRCSFPYLAKSLSTDNGKAFQLLRSHEEVDQVGTAVVKVTAALVNGSVGGACGEGKSFIVVLRR